MQGCSLKSLTLPSPTSKFHNPSQHPLSFLIIDILGAPIYNKGSCSHWHPCMSKHDHQRPLGSDYKARWSVLLAQQRITQIPDHEPTLISNDMPMTEHLSLTPTVPPPPTITDSPNHWPPLNPCVLHSLIYKSPTTNTSDSSSHPWSKWIFNQWWPKAFLSTLVPINPSHHLTSKLPQSSLPGTETELRTSNPWPSQASEHWALMLFKLVFLKHPWRPL